MLTMNLIRAYLAAFSFRNNNDDPCFYDQGSWLAALRIDAFDTFFFVGGSGQRASP